MRIKMFKLLPAKLTYFFWSGRISSFNSYYPVYLADIGFTPTMIGIITSLRLVSICLGCIFWSIIADKTKRYKVLLFTLVLTTVATTLPQPFIAKYMTKDFINSSLIFHINEIHGQNSTNGSQLSVSSARSTNLMYVLITLNIGFFFIAGLSGILENIMVQYVTLKDSIQAYGTQNMFGSIGAASISFLLGVIIDGNYLSTLSQYSIIFFVYAILSLSFLVAFHIILNVISQDDKDLHTVETVNIESNETEDEFFNETEETPFLTNDSTNNADTQSSVCKKNNIGSIMTDASTDIVGTLDSESKKDIASSTMSNIDGDIVDTTFSVCNENTIQSTNIYILTDTVETLNSDSSKYATISVTVEPSISCNAAQSSNDNPSSIQGTEYITSQDASCPSIMTDSSTEHTKPPNIKSNTNIFVDLRQAKVYMFFIMLLSQGIAKGVDTGIFMLHLRNLNSSNKVMGLALAVQYISTMALFPFSSPIIIKCGGKLNVICISCATFVVRFLLLAAIKNPWHILPLQCLQCINFALFWVAVVEYTHEISSNCTGNRMFSFTNAMYKDASRAFGVFLGGILLDIYGSPKTYLYLGLIYILVLFMHIAITIYLKESAKITSESNVELLENVI